MSTLQYGYAYRLVVYPRVTRRGQGALQLQSVPICISLYLKERRSKSNYLSRGDTLSCAVAAETRGGGEAEPRRALSVEEGWMHTLTHPHL